jgi:hypothetical protein
LLSNLDSMDIFVATALLLEAWEFILRISVRQREHYFLKLYTEVWGCCRSSSTEEMRQESRIQDLFYIGLLTKTRC